MAEYVYTAVGPDGKKKKGHVEAKTKEMAVANLKQEKYTVLNIEEAGEGKVTLKILATSKQTVRIVLDGEECEEYYNKVVTLSPEDVLIETVSIGHETLKNLRLVIDRADQNRQFPLLEWYAEPDEIRPSPDAAEAA